VVIGRASMGVPVGELQSTLARTTDCDWSAIGPPTHFFCHGQKCDYLSRALQRVRGMTNQTIRHWNNTVLSIVNGKLKCNIQQSTEALCLSIPVTSFTGDMQKHSILSVYW